MKLKTLKDLEFDVREGVLDGKAWRAGNVDSGQLKKELGIKWIKEFDRLPLPREELENQKFLNEFVFNEDTHHALVGWIRHVFNITKEDLK